MNKPMAKPESDKFWDGVAAKYSQKAVPNEAMYQKKLKETQSYFSSDMRVVEFGCGTGTTAIHHAPFVGHIDAIDISENMLEIGRERAHQAGVDNVEFHLGTLHDFNAESENVDAVLGLNVIHLIPNWQQVIAEVARILKPGGVFVSSTGCLGGSYMRFLKLIVPVGKYFGLMPDLFVITEDELSAEIKAAGFSIESQWHYGHKDMEVFIIARKNAL